MGGGGGDERVSGRGEGKVFIAMIILHEEYLLLFNSLFFFLICITHIAAGAHSTLKPITNYGLSHKVLSI